MHKLYCSHVTLIWRYSTQLLF